MISVSKHLSTQQIDKIVNLLDAWPSGTNLTWESLRNLLHRYLTLVPTRQTLANHPEIKEVYDYAKDKLRTERPISAPDPVLVKKVRRLEAENARLRAENQALLQRFVRWAYNAYKRGLMPHHLDEPCPLAHRRRSD